VQATRVSWVRAQALAKGLVKPCRVGWWSLSGRFSEAFHVPPSWFHEVTGLPVRMPDFNLQGEVEARAKQSAGVKKVGGKYPPGLRELEAKIDAKG
jgi:hypothetical protein